MSHSAIVPTVLQVVLEQARLKSSGVIETHRMQARPEMNDVALRSTEGIRFHDCGSQRAAMRLADHVGRANAVAGMKIGGITQDVDMEYGGMRRERRDEHDQGRDQQATGKHEEPLSENR